MYLHVCIHVYMYTYIYVYTSLSVYVWVVTVDDTWSRFRLACFASPGSVSTYMDGCKYTSGRSLTLFLLPPQKSHSLNVYR